MREWKDRLGIFASAACAVHCAATPILIATLPALKFTEWMADPRFHQVVAVLCCGLVGLSIWPAFLRFRDMRILSLSSAGLGLIVSAAFLLPDACCSSGHALPTDACACADGDLCVNGDSTHATHAGHDHDDHDGHDGHHHAHHDDGHSEHASSEIPDWIAGKPSETSISPSLAGIGLVQPWMTPIGGLLLIAAHVLNLRRRLAAQRSELCCNACDRSVGLQIHRNESEAGASQDSGILAKAS